MNAYYTILHPHYGYAHNLLNYWDKLFWPDTCLVTPRISVFEGSAGKVVMMKLRSMIVALGAVLSLAASPALATPVETFDLDSSSSTQCGTTLCGTLSENELSSTELQITVDLTPGVVFAKTGAAPMLEINLSGLTLSDVSFSGFAATFTGNTPSGFSIAEVGATSAYILECSGCNGTSNEISAITFDIKVSSGTIGFGNFSLASGKNGNDIDLGGPNCNGLGSGNGCATAGNNVAMTCPPTVGSCGTQGNPTPIPEPMTVALFGAGLAGMGAIARRRKARKSEA